MKISNLFVNSIASDILSNRFYTIPITVTFYTNIFLRYWILYFFNFKNSYLSVTIFAVKFQLTSKINSNFKYFLSSSNEGYVG